MMYSTTEHKSLKKNIVSALKIALTCLFWLGLWQLLYIIIDLDVLLASPVQVFKRLCELVPTKAFWLTILQSFLSVAAGYIIGVLLGLFFGIVTAFSKTLRTLLKPFITAVKTTPVVSFIILALIWLPKMQVPVFITVLMVMPVVWSNTAMGIVETDKELIEMADAYNLGAMKKLKYIYLPSTVPPIMNACITAVGLGWKAGIAAEVLSAPANSIGINLKNAQIYLETVDLFSWTVVVIILSLFLEKFLVWLMAVVFDKIIQKGGYFIENRSK